MDTKIPSAYAGPENHLPEKLVKVIQDEPAWLPIHDAMRYCGLPTISIRRLADNGDIRSALVTIPGEVRQRLLVERESLIAYIRASPSGEKREEPAGARGGDAVYVSSKEIAAKYSVSATHVMKMAEAGQIPGFRFGTVWRFCPAAVHAELSKPRSFFARKLPKRKGATE